MKNKRKLVAALACRAQSQRLYAKPLQNLKDGLSIIDLIINNMKECNSFIDDICLGIAHGVENYAFIEVAKYHQVPFIFGDEKDVLSRLITCGEFLQATDVFRVTPECPFIALEYLDEVYKKHTENNNDVSVLDGVPHGMHFEIYTLNALRKSHQNGTGAEKSEYCSLYIRNHRDQFKVEVITPGPNLIRSDIRVTADYPEDLVVCRELYTAFFEGKIKSLSLSEIIQYLDSNQYLKELNSKYCLKSFFWI